jgi:HAD superfamily hydrolase (TIGR01509 family)
MSKKYEIKAIIFDFGNVLVIDGQKAFEKMFKLDELPKWKRNRYEAATHVTEKGIKPIEYLLETIKRVFNLKLTTQEIKELLFCSEQIQPMIDLLHELRKQPELKIAILTNNQKGGPETFIRKLGLDLKGVKIFNSSSIGSRKPQKAPYIYTLKKLGVLPEETIFIDDKKINVEAANRIGIKGIIFDGNMHKLLSELKKFGIQVRI